MIYFIQRGEFGPIKIGYSTDAESRLTTLQTSNSEKLRLIGVIPGEKNMEQTLHQVFSKYRLSGEWFEPCPSLLDYIDKNAKKPIQYQIVKFALENIPDETIEFKPGILLQDALEKVEIALIRRALADHGGRQANAGKSLGISKSHMQYKLKKYQGRLGEIFINRNNGGIFYGNAD